jgi:hypothetical protein
MTSVDRTLLVSMRDTQMNKTQILTFRVLQSMEFIPCAQKSYEGYTWRLGENQTLAQVIQLVTGRTESQALTFLTSSPLL